MKIDGRSIADKILTELKPKVVEFKAKGVVPTLAVVLVSDDLVSLSYIKQKQKAAEEIGAKVILKQLPATTTTDELHLTIQQFNNDNNVHGVIIQRPLPKDSTIDKAVLNEVRPEKDVDGFVPHSPFTVPVAAAVLKILETIYELTGSDPVKNRVGPQHNGFDLWLKNQCSVIIGRGETAGKPIAIALGERGCMISVVHSQTTNPTQVVKKMNIVVSCVGKERVVTREMVAPGTILIGVGLWRDSAGKLRGDYEEDEIRDVAAYYTPTPGGVGPVNVACLMQNLVRAASNA